MSWIEFSVHCSAGQAEPFEDFLLTQGALAVTFQDLKDDAIFEPALGTTPLWQHTKLTALFDTQVNPEALFARFQAQFKDAPKNFHAQALEDRDWEREWLKHYRSMCFGERLWVIPNLPEYTQTLPPEIKADHQVLLMDPGLAFGTGTHETTALCLEWLAQHSLQEKYVIDYGCGSGILAVAAKLLGAANVAGCDLDPQALLASRENAARNSVNEHCLFESVSEFRTRFQNTPAVKADIVLANILAGTLEILCEELANLLDADGMIVLSGILDTQAEHLIEVYQKYFHAFEQVNKNNWVRISARKKPGIN